MGIIWLLLMAYVYILFSMKSEMCRMN